jgi:hypothetical protein
MTDAWQKIGVARIVDVDGSDPNSSGNTNFAIGDSSSERSTVPRADTQRSTLSPQKP